MSDRQMKGIFFRDIVNDHLYEILKEMYIDQVYKPYLEGRKDLVIMDVGANIGLFTMLAYPHAKIIYPVEPSQEHYETLVTMLTFNNMHNAAPLKVALSNEVGEATFYHNPNSTMYSLKQEVASGEDDEVVEVLDMESLMRANDIKHIDFMKLDVEGAEALIVNSPGFEKVCKNIDLVVGEWHTWCGATQRQFQSAWEDLGYEFQWLGVTEASLFAAKRK